MWSCKGLEFQVFLKVNDDLFVILSLHHVSVFLLKLGVLLGRSPDLQNIMLRFFSSGSLHTDRPNPC